MALPSIIDDGNFLTAAQNGPTQFEFPFADSGDFTSFIATVTKRVDADNFTAPTPMSSQSFTLGVAYLVEITQPRAVTNSRLLEYDEIWANVPSNRIEYEEITVDRTLPDNVFGVGITTYTFTDTYAAQVLYEYSLTTPLPVLHAQRLISGVYAIGISSIPVTGITSIESLPSGITEGSILAENSRGRRYRGQIFERASVYYVPPTYIDE